MAWLTGAFALVCLVQAQASKPTLVEKILNFTGGPQLEARSGDQIGWMQVYCYDVGFKTSKSAAFYLDYGYEQTGNAHLTSQSMDLRKLLKICQKAISKSA